MSTTQKIFDKLEEQVNAHLEKGDDVPQDLWKRYYQMLTILGKKQRVPGASLEAKRSRPGEKQTAHEEVF